MPADQIFLKISSECRTISYADEKESNFWYVNVFRLYDIIAELSTWLWTMALKKKSNCSECGETFPSKAKLNVHLKTHKVTTRVSKAKPPEVAVTEEAAKEEVIAVEAATAAENEIQIINEQVSPPMKKQKVQHPCDLCSKTFALLKVNLNSF